MLSNDRRHLQADLLRQVSRSFYLSMKALPRPMRDPVSLGYLLARASDTLADTASVPGMIRREKLAQFRQSALDGESEFGPLYESLLRDFLPRQENASERELLQRLPECLDWLRQMDEANRSALETVLNEITTGQLWDLERFDDSAPDPIRFCRNATELETYTYRVAGCVGEFWTRTGLTNLGEKFAAAENGPSLETRGRSLGQGLQLINILRDLGEDLRNGRCYLPKNELLQAGWQGDQWQDNETVLLEVAAAWLKQCRNQVAEGRRYLSLLKRGRVRYATALPMILAEKTADLLEQAGPAILQKKVKIPRRTVRLAMIEAIRA